MEEKKIICIRCPRGCEVKTTVDGYTVTNIEGNFCKLGEEYVKNEVKDPRRIVTSTVKVKNGEEPLVSVWTSAPVPKARILELMEIIRDIEVEAPVEINQVLAENIFDEGIELLTSSHVNKIA